MPNRFKTALIIILAILILAIIAYFTTKHTPDNQSQNSQFISKNTSRKTIKKSEEGTYNLNLLSKASELQWKASKQIGAAHNGSVGIKSGTLVLKDGEIIDGDFVIDMKTITVLDLPSVGADQLSTHLDGKDFFMVDSYPEAKISITKSTTTGNNTFNIDADLTIKGQTNPITLKATETKTQNQIFVKADFSIDRTQWNIRYGSGKFFDDLGDKMIKDAIDFKVSLVFANPFSKQGTEEAFIDLKSRIEGGNINVEKSSVQAVEYRELSSRIEGEAPTAAKKSALSKATEYRSLDSRIE